MAKAFPNAEAVMIREDARFFIDLCGCLCDVMHMATNVLLDKELISEAQRLGKHPSKRATIEDALREYVQRRQQIEVINLFGQIDYDDKYDYKSARTRK